VGIDPRIIELPAMGNRWLRSFTTRHYNDIYPFDRAPLLHVIHEEMAEPGLALAEVFGIPYVQTVDDFSTIDRGLRLSGRYFRELVVTNAVLADDLIRYLRVPAGRISVIPPGVASQDEEQRSTDWKIPVIGAVGKPGDDSGFDCFLEAARAVVDTGRDVEFVIGSQSRDGTELRRLAQAYGVADRVSIADLAVLGSRLWKVLDVYCQPSPVPTTGRSLALAMAEAVPCIVSNVRGLPPAIEQGKSCLVIAPRSPGGLAAAMTQYLDHPEAASEIGRRGREIALEGFVLENEASRLAAIYRRHARIVEESPDED
jgi:glycosyltransferase involved in cell wall biosynthesis